MIIWFETTIQPQNTFGKHFFLASADRHLQKIDNQSLDFKVSNWPPMELTLQYEKYPLDNVHFYSHVIPLKLKSALPEILLNLSKISNAINNANVTQGSIAEGGIRWNFTCSPETEMLSGPKKV